MKMRITIEVERVGPLTDEDLSRVTAACAHVVGVNDKDHVPIVGHTLCGGLVYGYDVQEVSP